MARENTDLPFGDAFSPAQLETGDDEELVVILELVDEYEGRPDEFNSEIQDRFYPSMDRAKNVRLGVGPAGYRIVDEDFQFTEFGEELYDLRDDPDELYDRFAQHILRNLHGLKGIEIVEDLEAQGRSTTNDDLKHEFREQYGFHIDETSNHWSQMRAWMSKAGVVNTGTHIYKIDRTRIEELIGVGSEDILELDGLSDQQQAFLRALALINPKGRIQNSVVKQVAERAYGVDISQSNISRRTLDPLEEAGYIEWEHVSGKANWIETTDKFDAEVLKPILDDLAGRTGVPRHVLRLSFDELLDDLNADSTHEKGVALETLAVKIGRLLGLTFVGWRVRGRRTGGSEVDVVMDDIGELYNRAQVQCKNTQSQIQTKHIAREVGISRMLQTNTILMIARSGISGDARQFANRVMRHENIAVMFLTGDDLEELDQNTTHLHHVLQGESRRISNLKRLGEAEYVEDEDEEVVSSREEEALNEYQEELEKFQESVEDASLGDFG
ncbi:restriction endonuclease [Saliphagus sp. GCM10025308]